MTSDIYFHDIKFQKASTQTKPIRSCDTYIAFPDVGYDELFCLVKVEYLDECHLELDGHGVRGILHGPGEGSRHGVPVKQVLDEAALVGQLDVSVSTPGSREWWL